MSLITSKLPTELIVKNTPCEINTDFRVWIKVAEIISSRESAQRKATRILRLVYKKIPPNFEEAIKQAIRFYAQSKPGNGKSVETKQRVFDYEHDAESIYASFMQQYRIDLVNASLHWVTFKALLDGLNDDTRFVKTIQYRCMDLSKIKDKDQRKFYADMKRAYALPDCRSEKEKEQDFCNSFASLF